MLIHDANQQSRPFIDKHIHPIASEEMDLSKVFKGSLVRVIAELRSLIPKGAVYEMEISFRGV